MPTHNKLGPQPLKTRLRGVLEPEGFRSKGNVFHRPCGDGLVQIVHLQHGRSSLAGQATVNIAIYVPEIREANLPGSTAPKVPDPDDCAIVARIGALARSESDLWWDTESLKAPEVAGSWRLFGWMRRTQPKPAGSPDIGDLVRALGLPFLERFSTRTAIVRDWAAFNDREIRLSERPRLDVAIILARQGWRDEATRLMAEHLSAPRSPRHVEWVRSLASSLGLDPQRL